MKATTKQILTPPRFKQGAFTPDLSGKLVSKAEKFNWKISDREGVFMKIDKSELQIPPEYQRKNIRERFILEVAKEWKWVSFGTLSIVYREGVAFVMDGQHRKLAADKRSDIKLLPCMVFEDIETVAQEAQGFIDINLRRARIGSVDMYRAQLAAGEPTAVFVHNIIERAGLKVDAFCSTKTIACIGTLLFLAKSDKEMFSKLWPFFISVHQDCAIFSNVMSGIWYAEIMQQAKGKSLLMEPSFSKLIRIGGRGCLSEIARRRVELGKGGSAVCRDAIMSLLKKKI